MDAEQFVHDFADRVRKMLTEAEERAAEIVRDAEVDAKRIREQAETESRDGSPRRARRSPSCRASSGSTDEVEPGPVTVPEPEPPRSRSPSRRVPEPTPPEPPPEPEPAVVPEPTPPPDEGTPPSADGAPAKSDDVGGARLVALNMALDGASREEIEAKLAEDYALADSAKLVDEVLAVAAK